MRFYTRALLPPSIIGTATYVVYWLREDLYLLLVPAFCLLLMLWSAVFVELWQARERTLRHVWGMEAFAEQEGERLGFRGKLDQGIYTPAGDWVTVRDADLAMMGYRLPAPKAVRTSRRARLRRQACSFGVLLCMGFLCILSTLGIFAFRAYIASLSIGPYLAGALNAVAITLLNTAFREAALKLNEWENHRRASSFTGALVYKMFIFQFINCYFSLFFIVSAAARRRGALAAALLKPRSRTASPSLLGPAWRVRPSARRLSSRTAPPSSSSSPPSAGARCAAATRASRPRSTAMTSCRRS